MGDERTDSGAGVPEQTEVQERSYNDPPEVVVPGTSVSGGARSSRQAGADAERASTGREQPENFRLEDSMGDERTDSGTSHPEPSTLQKGYNLPPVAKVERPAPSRPAPKPQPPVRGPDK